MSYNPSETQDPDVAAHAFLAAGALPRIARRDGRVSYIFDTKLTADGKPLDARFANLAPTAYHGHAKRQLAEHEGAFLSEEHRRQRQGANAAAEPSYSKAELERMSNADQQAEMSSIKAAMAARRVGGFVYEPERAPKPMLFTKSQLRSMHPDDEMAIHGEIMAAIKNGQVDFSK